MLKKSAFFSTFLKIVRLLPPSQKKSFWLMLVLIFFTSIVDLVGLATFIPIISAIADPSLLSGDNLLAHTKNALGIEGDKMFILILFLGAFTFLLFRIFFIIWSQAVQAKFVFRFAESIGASTYHYYLNAKFEDFSSKESGMIIRELTGSPVLLARSVVLSLWLVTSELLVISMIVLSIAVFNVYVFLLLILTIFPAAYFFQLLTKKKIRALGELENKLTPELLAHSIRGIFGYIDVKLRSKENTLISDYLRVFKELNGIKIRTSVLAIVPAKMFEFITVAGLLIIVLYSYFWTDNSAQVLPLITLYAAAGYRVIPSLSKIMPAMMQLEQYQYLFKLYDGIFGTKQITSASIMGNEPIDFNEEIRLKNIEFYFRSKKLPLFSDLNLTIRKGEVLGVIGRSGSGKTTLVNLLTGFYHPSQGEILIDGKKLDNKNMVAWRGKISYVQQSSYLEKGSLASNIAFLEQDIDHQRLAAAIKGACLDEFLADRDPEKVSIDEGGKNLSGGQKQRVIIARALYHNSSLIILDEATSALDNETENAINETIQHLRDSMITIVIIAHRYSTLKHTDRIIKMNAGKIEAQMHYNDITY